MTSQATIVELLGQPKGRVIEYTCLDGQAIEKGDVLGLSSSRTVFKTDSATADGAVFAGIAATEKVANDGSTTIGVWTEGIFVLPMGVKGASVGDAVCISGANIVGTIKCSSLSASGISFDKFKMGRLLNTPAEFANAIVEIGGI